MEPLVEWINQVIGISPDVQYKLAFSALILLSLWLLHKILQRAIQVNVRDRRARYNWQKLSAYLLFGLGMLLVGAVLFERLQSVATYLGLLSAGLAVALKDPITDVMGWLFIILRRPFEVGDRIQIGDYAGDVIDLRVFQFSMMEIGNWVAAEQSTGRLLHVPNGRIFTSVLANYTKGSAFIWNEIPVLITFESDWNRAKEILEQIARRRTEGQLQQAEASFREASNRYLLQYGTLTPIVYTSVKDSGVLLTIRYLTEPRNRRSSTQEIWEDILSTFAQHSDIDFAYPTYRIYNQQRETHIEQMT